jgi:hypothetical protein
MTTHSSDNVANSELSCSDMVAQCRVEPISATGSLNGNTSCNCNLAVSLMRKHRTLYNDTQRHGRSMMIEQNDVSESHLLEALELTEVRSRSSSTS